MKIITSSEVNWQDYRDLRLKALKEEPQSFGSSYVDQKDSPDEEWQNRLEEYKKGIGAWMFFAEHEGKLVAMVGGWQEEADKLNGVVHMMGMYVVPEERGKGISKLLINALIGELKTKPQIKKITLSVNTSKTAAFNLYKNVGFIEVERKMEKLGDGEEYEVVVMEREME